MQWQATMAEAHDYSLMPPDDPSVHLDALRNSYVAGDVIALLQAVRYAETEDAATPIWAVEPLANMLKELLTKNKLGTRGNGNAPFGYFKKRFARSVRASAYLYIRAWQRDPHRYQDMPRATHGPVTH